MRFFDCFFYKVFQDFSLFSDYKNRIPVLQSDKLPSIRISQNRNFKVGNKSINVISGRFRGKYILLCR